MSFKPPAITKDDVLDFVEASSYGELALYSVGPVMFLMFLMPVATVLMLVLLGVLGFALFKTAQFFSAGFVRKVDFKSKENGGMLVAEVLQSHGEPFPPPNRTTESYLTRCALAAGPALPQASSTSSLWSADIFLPSWWSARSATSAWWTCAMRSPPSSRPTRWRV